MLTTRFTELVGCAVPIQQAGMGAVSPPELAAAVSNAGALGMLGTARTGARTLPALERLLDDVQALTDAPSGSTSSSPRRTWRPRTPAASRWRRAGRGWSSSSGAGPIPPWSRPSTLGARW